VYALLVCQVVGYDHDTKETIRSVRALHRTTHFHGRAHPRQLHTGRGAGPLADLALWIAAGPSGYLQERTIGPSLGADAIRSGVIASVVGLLLVVAFMLVYYHGVHVKQDDTTYSPLLSAILNRREPSPLIRLPEADVAFKQWLGNEYDLDALHVISQPLRPNN
jgi:hypothetical protein